MQEILGVQHFHSRYQLVRKHERRLEGKAVPATSEQGPERSTEEVADHKLDALAVVKANVVEGCDAGLVLEHPVKGRLV